MELVEETHIKIYRMLNINGEGMRVNLTYHKECGWCFESKGGNYPEVELAPILEEIKKLNKEKNRGE